MKVVIASCAKYKQINNQDVWAEIQNEKPDLLVLSGDNVYLEHDRHKDPKKLSLELKALYKQQFSEKHFQELIKDINDRGARLLAIYDDHDFLGNNRYGAEHDPALREAARKEFINAFNPTLTGNDVYSNLKLGDIEVVVLDARYYREAASISSHDRNAVLGEDQWNWLENIILRSTSKYFMVVSSTTFHKFTDESWEQYPVAFNRLHSLLANKSGKLIVSGDIHTNDLYDDSGVLEIISSGVARKGIVFGGMRRNYGVLVFKEDHLDIDLRGLKANVRFKEKIYLNKWKL